MTDYIYDIETYPNCFTMYIGNADTRKCRGFEISFRKDQREEMFKYLRQIYRENGRMVGFNNVGFDYPVLHNLLQNKKLTAKLIYLYAMDVIEAENKWEYIVRDKDVLIPQIDLYKIHHFDNKARATSLKMIEFNMRSDNIEDLPFPVGKELTSDEIDVLLKYNKHDMLQTFLFYEQSKGKIKFRENLGQKYGKSFMNHNDTKIGKDYFIMRLEESIPNSCYNKGKVRQTRRSSIDLNDCIFDYIKFERPEFNAILEWLKSQTIKETKGVFTDLLESDLGEVAKYAEMRTKSKKLKGKPTDKDKQEWREKYPACWFEERPLKSGKNKFSYYVCWNVADNLNVVIDGLRYDYGTGGLHASIESASVSSDDEFILIDQDVASYYPNLAIKNRVYPEHLSEQFCDIYEDVYVQRKSFPKGSDENLAMKLALNGVYGDSNNQYSPFYDPKYTMTITINGQLSLCMLAEELLKIDGLSIIQCNTDGLTFRTPRVSQEASQEVCNKWEELTKLELEGVEYKAMHIRDVNNYIAEYEGGVKRKGAYEYDGLDWNKNHSALVIKKAAEAYLVRGEDVESFIRNHDDHMDFMLRTKVPRSSRLVMVDDFQVDQPLQNICRYYVSEDGGELVKIMPPVSETKPANKYVDDEGNEYFATTKAENTKYAKKYTFVEEVEVPQPERRIGIETGWKCKPCNDINDYSGNINYDYYIQEAMKLVDFKDSV